MALFGSIGKALGLGSARDVFGDGIGGFVEGVGDTINEALPTIGAAVGYAYGGPAGASLGSGLGTAAQGGRSTKDILTNAALAFGAAKVAPSFGINQSTQTSGIGQFIPDTSGFTINPFSGGATTTATQGAGAGAIDTSGALLGDPGVVQGLVGTDASGSGIADFFSGMDAGDYLMAGSLGLGALGLAGGLGGEEEVSGTSRPYPKGEAFGTVQDQEGRVYEISDPVQMAEYNKMIRKYQEPDFSYDTDRVIVRNTDDDDEVGILAMANGGSFDDFVDGEVQGPGTGTSDSVPAKLSDGEFVLTAKSVRGAGGGDRDIGAARLYDMMADLEATA